MTDTSIWLPLGTAVIGATAALAGNALGPFLGGRREHEQWLRNKRAETLEAFYEALDEAQHNAGRGYNFLDDDERQEARQDCRAMFDRLVATSARAQLYTTNELAELMSLVAYDFQVVYESVDEYTPPEWLEVHQGWLGDVLRCVEMIRNELRVE